MAEADERASRAVGSVLPYLALILALPVPVGLFFTCRRILGDKRGEKKLQQIHEDIQLLLDFLVNNPHSLKINNMGIGWVQEYANRNADPETLRLIAKAAEQRWAKGSGYLNEEVGKGLHEIVRGLDNVINRT